MSSATHDRAEHRGLLPTADAAARLGVKAQTLYAYVSRGLLTRTVAIDGRSSLFDPAELDELKRGRGRADDGELRAVIATAITRVDDKGLLLRGRPLVDLVGDGATFVDVVELALGAEPQSNLGDGGASDDDGITWPAVEPDLSTDLGGLDGLRVIVAQASAADPMRHDLSARSVGAITRRLVTAMTHGLPTVGGGTDSTIVRALWRRLSARRASLAQARSLEVALALLVDHGLASSTFAARIAASVRADPYSVVSAGLGALGGPRHGAASAAAHRLISAAAQFDDAARVVGEHLRTHDAVPGFGHTVYRLQDPRYGALMAAVNEGWSRDPRLAHVHRIRDVVAERRDDPPNVDLALGALTFLAGMAPESGETIFAVARTPGWLAHAAEEYGEAALRFRPRARYVGAFG